MTNPRIAPALLTGLAVAAATFPAAARAQAAEPELLKRSTKWEARFEAEACHLVTAFGEGDAAVVAFFSRYQPGEGFNLSLVGKRFRDAKAKNDVRVDFGVQPATWREVRLDMNGETAGILLQGARIDGWEYEQGQKPPAITPEQEAGVRGVTVRIGTSQPIHLETGSLGKPLAMLRTCTTDLVKSWGYDPAVQTTLSRRAMPRDPSRGIGLEYPLSALKQRLGAVVQVRLGIDAEGNVVGCNVLDRAPSDEFAAATCRAFGKRASFEPALDADGKPVGSFYISRTEFRMP